MARIISKRALMFAIAVLLALPASSFGFGPAGAKQGQVRHRSFSKAEVERMEKTTAVIKTTFGEIKLRFFPDVAPNHVNNFIELAKSGFYNKTVFHRVIPGFMVQGGDPNSRNPNRASHGVGGPPYVLKAEFNKRPHKRGTLSMARKGDPDSAGSQFFICVADTSHLDGQYTVFGEVVSGMDIVDRIVRQPRDRRDNPLERVEVTVKVIEPKAAAATKSGKAPGKEKPGK